MCLMTWRAVTVRPLEWADPIKAPADFTYRSGEKVRPRLNLLKLSFGWASFGGLNGDSTSGFFIIILEM
jgi:hypothetical protein